jgi:hypothetical protein
VKKHAMTMHSGARENIDPDWNIDGCRGTIGRDPSARSYSSVLLMVAWPAGCCVGLATQVPRFRTLLGLLVVDCLELDVTVLGISIGKPRPGPKGKVGHQA